MKKLYEFTLERDQEVEIIEERQENGTTVEVKKKVTQPVKIPLFIKLPNRVEREDIELQYDIEFSNLVKAGVLTRAMLDKEYAKQGGMWTEDEEKLRKRIREELSSKMRQYESDASLTEEEKAVLGGEIMGLEEIWTNFKNAEETLYGNCADNKARNKVINYLVSNFCYIVEEKNKPKLFFTGESTEDRLDDYADKEESDDKFIREATQFFAFFVTLWYVGGVFKSEDFAAKEAIYRKALEQINKTSESSSKETDERTDTGTAS